MNIMCEKNGNSDVKPLRTRGQKQRRQSDSKNTVLLQRSNYDCDMQTIQGEKGLCTFTRTNQLTPRSRLVRHSARQTNYPPMTKHKDSQYRTRTNPPATPITNEPTTSHTRFPYVILHYYPSIYACLSSR
jgi:hypothetical protein